MKIIGHLSEKDVKKLKNMTKEKNAKRKKEKVTGVRHGGRTVQRRKEYVGRLEGSAGILMTPPSKYYTFSVFP